jgi:hypothetical protein
MPKTEANSPLTKAQVDELLHLANHTYQDQVNLCSDAKAYLASCIMLGATVEAMLTAVTCLLFEEAIQTGKAPKYKKGETKDLLDWTFFELLDVAKEAKWLPQRLKLDERWDRRAVKTPVRTDTIREIRNLVHPARYLQDRSGKEYTLEELFTLYITYHAVYIRLLKKVYMHYLDLEPPKQALTEEQETAFKEIPKLLERLQQNEI